MNGYDILEKKKTRKFHQSIKNAVLYMLMPYFHTDRDIGPAALSQSEDTQTYIKISLGDRFGLRSIISENLMII